MSDTFPSDIGDFSIGESPIGGSTDAATYNPPISDLLTDAFERCGIRSNALTTEQLVSGRRSLNLIQSQWTNRGINLWKVKLAGVSLNQGQSTYAVDRSTIDVLDVFLRQYPIGTATNVAPAFTTVFDSTNVTIAGLSVTPHVGNVLNIIVPVAIGGLVLQGVYTVLAVPSSGVAYIATDTTALASVTGGTVPVFTTIAGSTTVLVALPAHDLGVDYNFVVQVPTVVGGIPLSGTYRVWTVPDSNTFTILAATAATGDATVAENGGLTSIGVQPQGAQPIDTVLYPISRTEYDAMSQKMQQGRPTSFWLQKTLSPSLTLWPVPDGNAPYQLLAHVMVRQTDADPTLGATGDMPARFYFAFVSALAADISMKWAPDRYDMLSKLAMTAWLEASIADIERVPFHIRPEMSAYF